MHLLLSMFNFLRINHGRKGKKKIREPFPAVVRVPPWGQRDRRKGGREHKPVNVGGLEKLDEARTRILPQSLQKERTLRS